MNKRGLSEVITTVLIILLVLGAIIIVWTIVKPMLEKSSQQMNIDSLTSSLSIAPNSLKITPDNNVTLKVLRKSGEGNITGVNIIIETSSGQRKTFKVPGEIKELETKTVSIPASLHGITEEITQVLVSANVEGTNGEEIASSITSGSKTPPPNCGNNITEKTEECDYGENNKATLARESIPYGTNSSYCNTQCKIINVTGPYCGDSIIDSAEQCDKTNFNGESCQTKRYRFRNLNCTSSCLIDTSPCYIPSDGLIGFWGLDETSGTTFFDNSGKGINGSCSGINCPDFSSSGKIGGTRVFRGVDTYISLASNDLLNLKDDLSFSFWMYPSQTSSYVGSIYSRTGNLWIYQDNNRYINFVQGGNPGWLGVTSSSKVNLNRWSHIVITKTTSDIVNIYIDGILDKTSTLDLSVSSSGRSFIGTWDGYVASSHVFNGRIDELAVWNRTLSQSEITKIYTTT
jgi:hypothetical protein